MNDKSRGNCNIAKNATEEQRRSLRTEGQTAPRYEPNFSNRTVNDTTDDLRNHNGDGRKTPEE